MEQTERPNSLQVKHQSTFTVKSNTIKTNDKLELYNIVMNMNTQASVQPENHTVPLFIYLYKVHFLQMMTETFDFELSEAAEAVNVKPSRLLQQFEHFKFL